MKWKDILELQGAKLLPYTMMFKDGKSSTVFFIQYKDNIIGYYIPDRNILSLYFIQYGMLADENTFTEMLTKCDVCDYECMMRLISKLNINMKRFTEIDQVFDSLMTRLRSVISEMIDISDIEEGDGYVKIPIPDEEVITVPFGTHKLKITISKELVVNEVIIYYAETFTDTELHKRTEKSDIYIDKNGNKWVGKIEGDYYVVRKQGGAK